MKQSVFCFSSARLVTLCYKSAEEKGKVLPLFADKLNSEEIRPLEEALEWQAYHRWELVLAF